MEHKDDDLIIDGNSVYEIDKNCETKLNALSLDKKQNQDFLPFLLLFLFFDL